MGYFRNIFAIFSAVLVAAIPFIGIFADDIIYVIICAALAVVCFLLCLYFKGRYEKIHGKAADTQSTDADKAEKADNKTDESKH